MNDELVTLGMKLQSLREKQGFLPQDIERITRIRVSYIEAIEDANYDALPGMVFARGFVKTYCAYLHAEDLWKHYEKYMEKPSVPGIVPSNALGDYTSPRKVFKKTSRTWIYILLLLSLTAAGYLIWQQRMQVKETIDSAAISQPEPAPFVSEPPAPPVISAEIAIIISQDAISSPVVSAPAAPDLSWMDTPSTASAIKAPAMSFDASINFGQAKITAKNACWVRVMEGKTKIFEKTLKAGEVKIIDITQDTAIRFGSPRNATLIFGAETLDPIDTNGRSPQTLYLSPDGTVSRVKP